MGGQERAKGGEEEQEENEQEENEQEENEQEENEQEENEQEERTSRMRTTYICHPDISIPRTCLNHMINPHGVFPTTQKKGLLHILYLAPPIPGGLHWSLGEQCGLQVDSTWNVLN